MVDSTMVRPVSRPVRAQARRRPDAARRMTDRETVADALAGDAGMRRRLVESMAPIVHRRVAGIVARKRPAAQARDLRQVVEDVVQDVFASCFASDARVLRSWDPARGLSFENFVGLVAEREALSLLRSAKRNPWTEDPTLADDEVFADVPDLRAVEARLESRNLIAVLAERLRERLSPLGMQYFRWLYIEQQPVDRIAERARTTPGAIYVWRSRLRRMVADVAVELDHEEERVG